MSTNWGDITARSPDNSNNNNSNDNNSNGNNDNNNDNESLSLFSFHIGVHLFNYIEFNLILSYGVYIY